MVHLLFRTFRRVMSTNPTSNFITLPNRPIVKPNGEIAQGPLKLHYWEWKGRQPTIVFCHAAAFHGRCYDPIISEALHGHHVVAIEFRGHGRSQQHPPPYRLKWYSEDVLEFILSLNIPANNLIGLGHSMGGYTLTYAAAIASKRLFRSLLLLDPAIVPRSFSGYSDKKNEEMDSILRRKSQWSSIEEMFSRFEKREPFSRWPKETLRKFCTYALDENFRMRLSPEGEYTLYESSFNTEANVFPLIEQSRFIQEIPVYIVRSSLPFQVLQYHTSPADPNLVKSLKKGHDMQLKGVDHFFPMEHPHLAIDFVKDGMKKTLTDAET